MIFVDTSAIVAILALEPDREVFMRAITSAERRITSSVIRVETCLVLASRLDIAPLQAERQFEKLLERADIDEIPVDAAVGRGAVRCFERFGRGRHPARLNFADCLSYACAKAAGARLLFKGDDFSKTDVNAQ